MAIVLTNNLLAMQLPQTRVVVRARRDEVGRVGAKCTIPHPALVARQGRLEGEGAQLPIFVRFGDLVWVNFPDFGRVVGGAGGEFLDVRREQDAGDVFLVGAEVGDGLELGAFEGLDQGPDEDVALELFGNVLACHAISYRSFGDIMMSDGCNEGNGKGAHCYWQRKAATHP